MIWLGCQVTSKEESFLDVSLDIEENISLVACLRNFSRVENLNKQDKFFCEHCCSLQEAQKRYGPLPSWSFSRTLTFPTLSFSLKLKKLPRIMVIHLKRFKYVEEAQRYVKLCHRVAFPLELRVPTADQQPLYHLFAVVLHNGSTANAGHYVSLIRSKDRWLLFDDDVVRPVDVEAILNLCFGQHSRDSPGSSTVRYLCGIC